jgi:hypothetical protein
MTVASYYCIFILLHRQHDYFYICGDDQFVIVENLRQVAITSPQHLVLIVGFKYLLSSEIKTKNDNGTELFLGRKMGSGARTFNTGNMMSRIRS